MTAPGGFPNAENRLTIAELDENKLPALVRHQCEANARLIAAAPELLALAQRLLALHPDQPVSHGDARTLCDDARALLARIEGR